MGSIFYQESTYCDDISTSIRKVLFDAASHLGLKGTKKKKS